MDLARELYERHLSHLPVMQRLRVASFILNDISPALKDIDLQKDFPDEEASDLARFLMEHAGVNIPVTPKSQPPKAQGKK
jgi:hypothetical protein